MIVLAAFTALILATALLGGWGFFARTRPEWLIDSTGLLVQGIAIPLLQAFVVSALLGVALPGLQGSVDAPFLATFAISFVLIDYAYYWNHRLLHGALWPWHALHHSARRLDVIVSSRNTLWTPLLIVYVWLNGAALFLLRDPKGLLFGIALTAALDLWRHSPLVPGPRLHALLSPVLITPAEHAWHHSRSDTEVNFGANLSLWDRLHGTWRGDGAPEALGVDVENPVRMFLWPDSKEGRT